MLAHSSTSPSEPDANLSASNDLYALLYADLSRVEREIHAYAQSEVSKVSTITEYVVSSGGKRIRPIMALASAQLCGGITEATYKLATAVEYIHTATLLHDDVLDDSDMRRGKLASRKVWGNTNSVLVGDFLFARAFELMVETHSLEILAILSKSASIIVAGEVQQLDAIASENIISRDAYLATIDAKTAELFRAACLTGAMSSGCKNSEYLDALACYGLNLGRAFQIIDDILDYTGDSDVIGKRVGDDFREQKLTLPLIIAFERCDKDTADRLMLLMKQDAVAEQSLTEVSLKLEELGAFELAHLEAKGFINRAVDALSCFGNSQIATELKSLAIKGLSRLN